MSSDMNRNGVAGALDLRIRWHALISCQFDDARPVLFVGEGADFAEANGAKSGGRNVVINAFEPKREAWTAYGLPDPANRKNHAGAHDGIVRVPDGIIPMTALHTQRQIANLPVVAHAAAISVILRSTSARICSSDARERA